MSARSGGQRVKTMVEELTALGDHVEKELDKLATEVDDRFQALLRQQLDAWAKRWPRHRFESYQGHGMLCIRVDPRVGGERNVDHIPPDARRGAIAGLHAEAEAFVTAAANLEWRLQTGDFAPISSITGG